jgi:hypothetical protein
MIRPHAFVAMPFGIKPGADGKPIDFNRVYHEYIAPALEMAGLESFRADKEIRAGDIRTDMFQELLVADLVVADLSIDNPNVWYELGVRHALRARGVVIVSGGQTPTAFDLYTDRKLRYGLKDGGPNPATIEDDKRKLTDMVKATMESWHGRKVSPVYNLMPNLQEPDWKKLRIGDVREFWEKYDAWENRLGLARRRGISATCLCWLRRRRSPSFAPMHGLKLARRCVKASVSDLRSNTWIEVWRSNPRISAPCKGRACVCNGWPWPACRVIRWIARAITTARR